MTRIPNVVLRPPNMAKPPDSIPDDKQFNEFLIEFQRESDRAAAVLAAAYLDDLLKQLLLASFVDDSKHCRGLVEPERALGSFSARISTCFAMGLITASERIDLDHLRWIRNRFAHKLHGLTFKDSAIAQRSQALGLILEIPGIGGLLQSRLRNDPRRLFDVAAALLGSYLRIRVVHAQRRQTPKPASKVKTPRVRKRSA